MVSGKGRGCDGLLQYGLLTPVKNEVKLCSAVHCNNSRKLYKQLQCFAIALQKYNTSVRIFPGSSAHQPASEGKTRVICTN